MVTLKEEFKMKNKIHYPVILILVPAKGGEVQLFYI
jgi:hypothetical protein